VLFGVRMATTTLSVVQVYTDGSCFKNPGPGGWAFVVVHDDHIDSFTGGELYTTNNRMELRAVIEALHVLKLCTGVIEVYTDSLWVLNCAQRLWKRNANLDMWSEYDSVASGKTLNWKWVRGHSGNKYNELVDKLARKKAEFYNNIY